jgi:hypothetical protein
MLMVQGSWLRAPGPVPQGHLGGGGGLGVGRWPFGTRNFGNLKSVEPAISPKGVGLPVTIRFRTFWFAGCLRVPEMGGQGKVQ